MTDEELLLAHNVYSNKGAYSLFLGSGISRIAGIPTGWEILNKLVSRVALLKTGSNSGDALTWYEEEYGKNANYSQVIEELTTTREERLNLLKPFFEATEDEITDGLKQPSAAHRAIAKLVQKGYVRVVVTTNFDRLMENALRELSIEATVISNPQHVDNVMPLIHSTITIIKVNGDYLDTNFLNLESELSGYDPKLIDLLQYVFENFGLITSGWSAKWDIALREIIESANKFRFSSYFTYLHVYENELKQLAERRHGKLIKVDSADVFFRELAENIEALEKGEKQNPLTRQVAVERLRRYITQPSASIQLYELIKLQQDSAYQTIFSQPLSQPNALTIKEVINFRTAQCENLCALLAEGVYWGNQRHEELWTRVLSKFAYPPVNTSSWAMWGSLAYLPALLIFYTVGIGAIIRKNYSMLVQLFSNEMHNPYRDGEKVSLIKIVNSPSVIEDQQINAVFGTNLKVPVSELLYKFIKPLYAEFIASDLEFDEYFDEFELIYSLKYIEIADEGWFPLGRYIYRRRSQNNIIYRRHKELDKKSMHEWVINGLYWNYENLEHYYNLFNTRIKEIGYH